MKIPKQHQAFPRANAVTETRRKKTTGSRATGILNRVMSRPKYSPVPRSSFVTPLIVQATARMMIVGAMYCAPSFTLSMKALKVICFRGTKITITQTRVASVDMLNDKTASPSIKASIIDRERLVK